MNISIVLLGVFVDPGVIEGAFTHDFDQYLLLSLACLSTLRGVSLQFRASFLDYEFGLRVDLDKQKNHHIIWPRLVLR